MLQPRLQESSRVESSIRLPAGPSGRWGPTLRIIRDPHAAFAAWSARYGDPFLVTALNGPIVVTGQPELIKQIFGADPDLFEPFAAQTMIPMFGAGSMLMLQGETHRRERKLMTPMFHGDRMKAYAAVIRDVALRQIAQVNLPSIISILPLTTRVSFEVIMRAIFGADDDYIVRRLLDAGRGLVKGSSALLFFSRKMHFSFLGLSPWDRFRAAIDRLDAVLDEEIDRRTAHDAMSAEDILSLLVGARYEDGTPISREHIRDELRTFLFAGHETSAIAMAWAMVHVHRNADVVSKLRAEIATVPLEEPAALAQLPYLKAVVQETLRIHPIVTEVLRFLRRPMELGPYSLPAGVGVAPAIVLTHYRQELYPEPYTFRPERFLERTFTASEYLPFGGGQRRCIGAAFASFEIAITLGTWLRNYNFELLESASKPIVPRRRNVTLGPSSPVVMRVTQVSE